MCVCFDNIELNKFMSNSFCSDWQIVEYILHIHQHILTNNSHKLLKEEKKLIVMSWCQLSTSCRSVFSLFLRIGREETVSSCLNKSGAFAFISSSIFKFREGRVLRNLGWTEGLRQRWRLNCEKECQISCLHPHYLLFFVGFL